MDARDVDDAIAAAAAEQRRTIVDPSGRPARKAQTTDCPGCGAPKTKRRLSSGFGEPHDICGECGHDFDERTIK
jgi:uncharacterized protein (DUF983 family)